MEEKKFNVYYTNENGSTYLVGVIKANEVTEDTIKNFVSQSSFNFELDRLTWAETYEY